MRSPVERLQVKSEIARKGPKLTALLVVATLWYAGSNGLLAQSGVEASAKDPASQVSEESTSEKQVDAPIHGSDRDSRNPTDAAERLIPRSSPESRLVMVVRAGPDLSKDELQETFQFGLKAANCKCAGGIPDIRDVSPSFFWQFDAIDRGIDLPEEELVQKDQGVEFRPKVNKAFGWEIALSKPKKSLKSLTLKYPNFEEALTPAANKDRLQKIGVILQGGDIYRVGITRQPIQYRIVTSEIDQPDEILEGEWPRRENYYLVSMKQFEGQFDELRTVLSDPSKVGNPLKEIRDVSEMRFLFANFGAVSGIVDRTDSENLYTLRIDTVAGKNASRAWVYFPLTEEEAAEKIQQFAVINTGSQMLQQIDAGPKVDAGKDIVFDEALAASWIELPMVNGEFKRSFEQKNLPKLKAKFKRLHYLLAYEFQNAENGDRTVIKFSIGGHQVYVANVRDPQWDYEEEETSNTLSPTK